MASLKVKIRLDNAEFEAEGARADIDSLLATWWEKVLALPEGASLDLPAGLPAKTGSRGKPKKARARTVPTQETGISGEPKFDANRLTNAIKQDPRAALLDAKVWHATDRYHKIALVCFLAKEALTSGDIQRVLAGLQIKMSLPAVSTTLAKNSSKFLTSVPRKQGGGGPARYTLTATAGAALQKVISATG